MRITLPDALADDYAVHAAKAGVTVDETITALLRRMKDIDPHRRLVVLGGKHLDLLAQKLHGGDVLSGDDLVRKVSRLAGIKFMGLDLFLSPAQLDELQHRALRQGKPMDQLVLDIWRRLADEFFHVGSGGESVIPAAADRISHGAA